MLNQVVRLSCLAVTRSLGNGLIGRRAPLLHTTTQLRAGQRLLSDVLFSPKHEWISLDASDKTIGTVGITNYAQEALGDVVYVQTPDVGTEYNQDDEVGAVESVKAANEIYTPVSGTVTEVNGALEEKPGLINTSCYDEGWIFKIKIKNQDELERLMDKKAYEAFLQTVEE